MREFTKEEIEYMWSTICFIAVHQPDMPDVPYTPGTSEWAWQDLSNRAGCYEGLKRVAHATMQKINKELL